MTCRRYKSWYFEWHVQMHMKLRVLAFIEAQWHTLWAFNQFTVWKACKFTTASRISQNSRLFKPSSALTNCMSVFMAPTEIVAPLPVCKISLIEKRVCSNDAFLIRWGLSKTCSSVSFSFIVHVFQHKQATLCLPEQGPTVSKWNETWKQLFHGKVTKNPIQHR